MDRMRRGGAGKTGAHPDPGPEPAVPARSRLITRPGKNRRRGRPWPRLGARQIVNACGRAIRRSAPVLAAGLVIAAVATAGYAGYLYLTTSPRFAIATIEIHGNHTLTADEVRGRMLARIGNNLFTTDVHGEAAVLRAEPWIANAEVTRQLPDTLVVDIEERAAAAVVMLDAPYLAEASGVPFRRCEGYDPAADLPVITGLERDAFAAHTDAGPAAVRAALAAIVSWRAVPERPPVDVVRVDGHGGLSLVTRGDLAIELGRAPDGVAARLHRFDLAWANLSPDERARARSIHVDHETRLDHVIVAFAAKD